MNEGRLKRRTRSEGAMRRIRALVAMVVAGWAYTTPAAAQTADSVRVVPIQVTGDPAARFSLSAGDCAT